MGTIILASQSRYIRTGSLCLLFGFFLHLVAFGSPYWMFLRDQYGVTHSGLWRVCVFDICDQFVHHGVKPWLHLVQASMCLALISQTVAMVTLVLHLLSKTWKRLKRFRRQLAVVTFAMTLLAGALSVLSVVVYGVRQGSAGFWELAWAYWLATCSTLLLLVSALNLALEARRLGSKPADQQPILQHSISVDSGMALQEVVGEGRHPRSASVSSVNPSIPLNVRLRHNSFSAAPLTPASPVESQSPFDGVFFA